MAKAIYSEGRTKAGSDASAMTLYADGRIYAAHYNSQNILSDILQMISRVQRYFIPQSKSF